MRIRFIEAHIILLALLLGGCASSRSGLDTAPERFRCYYDGRILQIGSPAVFADFIQFKGTEKPRLDVYLEVPHTQLHFAAHGEDRFDTEYHISIAINDKQNNIIDRKELTKKVSTTREHLSRYGASDRMMESFNLDPGEYRVIVSILDRSVNQRTQIREVVEIKPIRPEPVTMSDLLLIRSIRTENGRRIINPMLAGRVLTLTEPFSVFTEIYSNGEQEHVTLQYGIVRNYYNNDFLIDNPFSYRVQRPYHRTGIRIEDQDTVIVGDTTLTLKSSTTQVFIPFDHEIDRGSYEVFVKRIDTGTETPEESIRAQTEFMIHSIDFPHMTDVDQQIEALHYVASNRDLNYIRDGETVEDRRRRLNEYWQNVGAWKMSDYYERVRLANELFTTNVEGWKTPMGMVFIILGEPHLIDCRIGIERTEIWTYYMQTGGIEFVFVRERTADPNDQEAHYWVSSIRGGYSTWLNAINIWR
jgi:GWxTD domain-containing protein